VARLVPGMGPASLRRLLAHQAPLAQFKPPPSAAAAWPALVALMTQLRGQGARWPDDLQHVVTWMRPHLERLYDDARVRLADLEQLARIAAGQPGRERFVTELTLDPPEASSDEAGPPRRDEDYLILSTIHSAKGQEWSAVHVLNVVDGCLPADLATGSAAEIEEERRLLHVAMTRAKQSLTLMAPQRFHVTQQARLGSRHVYAPRSRFLTPAIVALFDTVEPAPPPSAGAAPQPGVQIDLLARVRGAF
jgi:DNA helicase-2/ATP-dependent DNA helicase PcrA